MLEQTEILCDVFICHVSEDKDTFVRPLASALSAAGLRVWYDEFTLKLGDSLPAGIDRGIKTSRFGVVVISPIFIGKGGWATKEVYGFLNLQPSGGNILPIWHNIDSTDVKNFSPLLGSVVGVKSDEGIAKIVDMIVKVVEPKKMASTLAEIERNNKEKTIRIMAAKPFSYFYRVPNIPMSLLRRACVYCRLPDAQAVLAIIDCGNSPYSWFRGHEGIVFTEQGIYFFYEHNSRFQPYASINSFTFTLGYESVPIGTLSNLRLNVFKLPIGEFFYQDSLFSPNPEPIVKLFNELSATDK